MDIYAQPELRVYLPGIEERHVVAAKFSGFAVDLNLTAFLLNLTGIELLFWPGSGNGRNLHYGFVTPYQSFVE